MINRGTIVLLIIAFVAASIIGILYATNRIDTAQTLEIAALTTLVLITAWYAKQTTIMAKEVREQRITASRPYIIQKAQQKKAVQATIVTDYFSHFEIYNAGNGPAIEPEIFLLDEKKNPIYLEDEITYLRAGEAPVKLVPAEFGKVQSLPNWIEPPVKVIPIHLVIRGKRTYLVSQYQSIFPYGRQPTWYQTWLPFESHKINGKEEIRLIPGKLEFREEVTEKERIIMPLVKGKPK